MATIALRALTGSFSDCSAIASSIVPQSSALLISYSMGRASSIEIKIDVTDVGSPDVANESHWYAPATGGGTPRNIISISNPSARLLIPLASPMFDGISGLAAMSFRVSLRAMGVAINATAEVTVITGS